VYKLIAKSSQCQLTALATAVLLALTSLPAGALSLGRITVQSALGEPIQAEVDFLDINAEEAATLSTRIASPDAFKAAGLDYNVVLGNLKTSLQRRANGQAFLKLSGDSIVNEPFVDIILEASWSSGRIVRDYTLLFDPPKLRSATQKAPDTTQLAAASSLALQPEHSVTAVPKPVLPATPATAPKPKAGVPSATASQQSLRVKFGQTASHIAAANLPANVSLDQMLVAMLRSNPNAFIQNNVNRVKAGAVLTLPAPQSALAIGRDEATRIVLTQSRDFNEFRRKLAGNVGKAQAAPSAREATGRVQTSVQDKKPAPATPDKLTLSKGTVQGKSGEDQLANARNAAQTDARAAELTKNITDLNKLAAAASAPVAATPAAPAATAAIPPASSAATPAITVPLPAQAPVSAAKPAAAKAAVKPSTPAPAAQPETGLIDTLLAEPLLPAGVSALLALLVALGIYKHRQRKSGTLPDSALNEDTPAESSSGGQSVDTSASDSLSSGSSMVYSNTQLDGTDGVDPLAEADVYLAYGRDLQAEEILKDALRTAPERVAIHAKLADIYAKRQDAKSLEGIATQAFNLTDGTGPQWEHICEQGLSIDPDNALYLPGGQPALSSVQSAAEPPAPQAQPTPTEDDLVAAKAQADAAMSQPGALEELDLDLDFSLEEPDKLSAETASPDVGLPPVSSDQVVEPALTDPNTIQGALDFTESAAFDPVSKLSALHESLPDVMPSAQTSGDFDVSPNEPLLSLDALPDLDLPGGSDPSAPAQPVPQETAVDASKDMLSFDIDSLSLDLADDSSSPPATAQDPAMDALETKLALAEEFRAIGDDDGARALIEEVIAESAGDTKTKAQAALAKL